MRAILDTSVLIAGAAPKDVEAAISVVSITELHFGALLPATTTNELDGPIDWQSSRLRSTRCRFPPRSRVPGAGLQRLSLSAAASRDVVG